MCLFLPVQSKKQKPLSVQLKFCSALVKEFFTKKHFVSSPHRLTPLSLLIGSPLKTSLRTLIRDMYRLCLC